MKLGNLNNMKKFNKSDAKILRQKAEELLKTSTSLSVRNTNQPISCSDSDALKIIHELDVHQIELELQNEELRLARSAELETLEKYIDLYDFAPSGYFTLSKEGKIIELNLSGASMLGEERSRLRNKQFYFFVSIDTKQIFNLFIGKIFKNKTKETCDITLSGNGNSPKYVHITGIATENNEQCLMTAIDITERKRAEEEIQKTQILLKASIESPKDMMILSIDKNYQYLYFNSSLEKAMRIANVKDVKIGMNLLESISNDEDRRKSKINIDRALNGFSHISIEEYGNAERHYYETRYNPIYNDKHEIIGATIFSVDITGRKQAEEALRESEEKYSKVFQTSPYAITITRAEDGKFIEVNDAFTSITGFTKEEAVTDSSVNLELWADIEDRNRIVTALLQGRNISKEECMFKKKNGEIITGLFSAQVIHVHGKLFILSSINDITDRKQAEKEILNLNKDLDLHVKQRTAELKEANKELETFSYSISHDLKAPLRHINGFINLFLDHKSTELTEQKLEYLKLIFSSATEMDRLIDAILSFSRLNSSEIQKTMICSSDMVQQVIKFFEPETQNRKITFNVALLPDVKGDEKLIRQVWTNLISNAIKYTGKKTEAIIDIGSRVTDTGTTFFVKDNGAGFNMKYAEKLFGVFQRLHRTRDFEGIGIGLANVNRIITRHGGYCSAEGEVGKGATFYFSLPNMI